MTSRKVQRSKVRKWEGTLSCWWKSFISDGSSLQLTSGTGIWHMLQMDRQQYMYSCKVLALLVLAHAASWPAESRSAGQFDFPQLLYKAWGQGRWEGERGACSWLVLAYSTEAEFTCDNCNIPGSNFLHMQALHLNDVLMQDLGLAWALWNL